MLRWGKGNASEFPSKFADLCGDVGVGRDGLVDRRSERTLVVDHLEATGRHDGRRVALAGHHALEHGTGKLVVELALVDEALQLRDLRGSGAHRGQIDAGLVRPAGQLAHPPLARARR